MRSTLALIFVLALPLEALAQHTGKLVGRVVDERGDALPGANVIVVGTMIGAASDIDGRYIILGIPIGVYSVEASFIGRASHTVTDVQIVERVTAQRDFAPGEAENEVVEYERPIVITCGIGVPKVVTGEEIQRLPVRGVQTDVTVKRRPAERQRTGRKRWPVADQ